MKNLLFLFILFTALPGLAAQPTHPAPGYDSQLMGGQTPEKFFEARRGMTQCRTELAKARETWTNAKVVLQDMVKAGKSSGEIDTQEELTEEKYGELVEKVQQCGDCAVQDVAKIDSWYITDGSCFINNLSKEELAQAFERRSESLLNVEDYPVETGGFKNIFTYFLVDPVTGKELKDTKATEDNFHSFISIKGPKLLGVQVAFGYFYENQIERKTHSDGDRQFIHNFTAQKPPRGFRMPRVYTVSASGKKTTIRHLRLQKVIGQWYIQENGYIRYFTAADFGMSLDFASNIARRILTETLMDMASRGVPKVD